MGSLINHPISLSILQVIFILSRQATIVSKSSTPLVFTFLNSVVQVQVMGSLINHPISLSILQVIFILSRQATIVSKSSTPLVFTFLNSVVQVQAMGSLIKVWGLLTTL